MTRKITFLFLALALPGLIFLFLKKFGKNEFGIPVFYEQGIDTLNLRCGTSYQAPYQISDSVLARLGWKSRQATLLVFRNDLLADNDFKRVIESFDDKKLQVVSMDSISLGQDVKDRWSSCVFMMGRPNNALLIDQTRKIRGYYKLGSREEADRLILELEILFKMY